LLVRKKESKNETRGQGRVYLYLCCIELKARGRAGSLGSCLRDFLEPFPAVLGVDSWREIQNVVFEIVFEFLRRSKTAQAQAHEVPTFDRRSAEISNRRKEMRKMESGKENFAQTCWDYRWFVCIAGNIFRL